MPHCFRTFIKLLEGLLELCSIKMSITKCFFSLSDINWNKDLQELVSKVSYFCFFDLCIIHSEVWYTLLHWN